MLSPLPLFSQFISLEMTLDIATLRWVLRARIKRQDFSSPNRRNLRCCFVIVLSSSNSYSTQNSSKHDAKWI